MPSLLLCTPRPFVVALAFLLLSPTAASAAVDQAVPIASQGVIGEYHAGRGLRHRTAVIMLNGSDGGIPPGEYGRDLATNGYPTLALAYLRDPTGKPAQVPATGPIPIEIVFRAIEWMKQRPEVAADRIVLMGISRGAELALLVAASRQDVAGVIAFSPGSHLWGGVSSPRGYVFDTAMWSLGGKSLPYQVHVPKLGRPLREWFAAGQDNEAARIPVERINGPVLLISSLADAIWPAADYADEIEQSLQERRHPFAVQNIKHRDASHLLMGPGPAPTEVTLPDTNGYTIKFGGTAKGTLIARNLSWKAVGRFLKSVPRGK